MNLGEIQPTEFPIEIPSIPLPENLPTPDPESLPKPTT